MTKPATSPLQTTLVFDTTARDQTTVALIQNGQVKKSVAPVRAQELQRLTTELLAKEKLTLKEVDAVAVLTGPGSFTGTRIGIVAANSLGWLTNKPIYELPGDDIDVAIAVLLKNHPQPTPQAGARY